MKKFYSWYKKHITAAIFTGNDTKDQTGKGYCGI